MYVALLEDSDDLRYLMRELIQARFGLTCATYESVADLQGRESEVLGAAVTFLDINLGDGKPSGIDAYRWLMERRYAGRIIFFTGHALRHPTVEQAVATGVGILSKPVSVQELSEILEPLRATR